MTLYANYPAKERWSQNQPPICSNSFGFMPKSLKPSVLPPVSTSLVASWSGKQKWIKCANHYQKIIPFPVIEDIRAFVQFVAHSLHGGRYPKPWVGPWKAMVIVQDLPSTTRLPVYVINLKWERIKLFIKQKPNQFAHFIAMGPNQFECFPCHRWIGSNSGNAQSKVIDL